MVSVARQLVWRTRRLVVKAAVGIFYVGFEPIWNGLLYSKYLKRVGNCVVSEDDIRRVLSSLQKGDALFGRHEAEATTIAVGILGSFWTHVALYVGNGMLIEALDTEGTVQSPVSVFLRRYTHVMVVRPHQDPAWDCNETLNFAFRNLGKDYNFDFLIRSEDYPAYYCSQFVFLAWTFGGLRLKRPQFDVFGHPVVSPSDLYKHNRGTLQVVCEVNRGVLGRGFSSYVKNEDKRDIEEESKTEEESDKLPLGKAF